MGDVGGEHLDRLDAVIKRNRHIAQRAREMADFVAAAGEVGNFDPGADTAADPLRAVGEPAHRPCDRAGQCQRQHNHHGGGDAADLQDGEAFGGDHLVDIVALGRKHQGAVDRAEALYGDGDRNDHLAAVIDAHHAALLAGQGLRHFRIAVAVIRPEFGIERQVAAIEPGPDRDRRAFGDPGLFHRGRRQFEAEHVAAAVEAAAVQNQRAVAIVNPGAGFGG